MSRLFFVGIVSIMLASVVLSGPCWSKTMKLVPSTPLTKVLRTSVQDVAGVGELRLDGARGETASAQVVLLPGDASDTVTPTVSELKSADGKFTIAPTAFRLQWVRYMDITKNTVGIPADELIGVAPISIPDPFWEDSKRPVEPGSPQPLWIDLEIPANATPGEYRAELTVSGGAGKASLPVTVRVRSFALSEQRHQRVMQWWAVPGRTFESLQPGTDEYWKHLKGMCELAHRYRQTDVRAEWSLVTSQKAADGSTYWDTSLFEKFAQIAFDSGLQAVQFAAAGRHTKYQLDPTTRTEAVEDNMGRLAAVNQVVEKRGWQGRVLTSLADEPFIYHEKSYQELLARARKVAPSVGVIEAIETEDLGDLDIYVPKLSHINLWWPKLDELKPRGEKVWFYTCCHPVGRYPNRFLDQPLVTARELHWITYLYGLDGYLHWGFNWYTADGDPYSEKGANPWDLPPGDSQVAYPVKNGWIGSLRLTAMRDGLQDYEYLWVLENRLRALKHKSGEDAAWLDPRQRSLELCSRVVQSFYDHTRNPQVLLDTRAAIADEIENLDAAPLLYVQTSPPENRAVPAGPIMINVHGITVPGAAVTINGVEVPAMNITSTGCFVGAVVMSKDTSEIVVTAEYNGVTRTCKRKFAVVE